MLFKSSLGLVLLSFLLASIASNSHSEIIVVDQTNRTVKLSKPVERVVALAPHIVESFFAAGAGDRLVAVSDYSDYPAEALKLPRVGSSFHYNIEAIIAQKPDLVIVWNSSKGGREVQRFEKLGIPVYVSEAHSFEDIAKTLKDFGVLAGTEVIANKRADQFLDSLNKLRNQNKDKAQVSVFYQVWQQPLQTINGDHVISKVMSVCGGKNVFASSPIIAPRISLESVVKENPEVLVTGYSKDKSQTSLNHWNQWPQMSAVKNNNLHYINPDILVRHTTRLAEGAEALCRVLDIARSKE